MPLAAGWPAIATASPLATVTTGWSSLPKLRTQFGVDVAVPQFVVHVFVHVQHHLRHRDVDPLAATGALPLVEGGEDAGGGVERRVDVRVAVAVGAVDATAAVVALGLGEAGLGLDDRSVRPTVLPRCRWRRSR